MDVQVEHLRRPSNGYKHGLDALGQFYSILKIDLSEQKETNI